MMERQPGNGTDWAPIPSCSGCFRQREQQGRTRRDRRHLSFLRVFDAATRTAARHSHLCMPVEAWSPPSRYLCCVEPMTIPTTCPKPSCKDSASQHLNIHIPSSYSENPYFLPLCPINSGFSVESVGRNELDQSLQVILSMMVGVLGVKGTLALLGASRP